MTDDALDAHQHFAVASIEKGQGGALARREKSE
jgi:hypothetical protein